MGIYLDVTGVDHQPLEIRCVDQLRQEGFPSAIVTPAAEAAVRVLPIAMVHGQVAPWRAGTQNPEHATEKASIVLGDASPFAFLPRQMRLEQFPGVIGEAVAMIRGNGHESDVGFFGMSCHDRLF